MGTLRGKGLIIKSRKYLETYLLPFVVVSQTQNLTKNIFKADKMLQ